MGWIFRPRHGIGHYARKHSGHAGLIGAGIGLGAASDLAIGAIRGEEAAPVYFMEGGEDAVTTVTDDSWNILKISEMSDNFAETTETENVGDPEELSLLK